MSLLLTSATKTCTTVVTQPCGSVGHSDGTEVHFLLSTNLALLCLVLPAQGCSPCDELPYYTARYYLMSAHLEILVVYLKLW